MTSEVDVKTIWKDLDAYEKELDKEGKSLQEIWTKLCQLHTKTEDDIARYSSLYFLYDALSTVNSPIFVFLVVYMRFLSLHLFLQKRR